MNGATDMGFVWGPVEVTRLLHVPGRGRALMIETEHSKLEVYVSEAGRRIRCWLDGQEIG